MAFRFADLGALLSNLEDIELRDPPLLPADRREKLRQATGSWFKSYRTKIDELDATRATALISSLLPERRTDRVYGIQSSSLCKILSRGLNLTASRVKDLQAYEKAGNGDLAACLERVLKAGGPPGAPPPTVEEVDDTLSMLASQNRFSDPAIRLPPRSSDARNDALGNLFKRLEPVDAKWLVRLTLKDFSPVRLDENLILKSFHFLLPDLLRFQNNFHAAIALLKGPLHEYATLNPDPRSEQLLKKSAASLLHPVVGIKVGRPTFQKARSIDHCLNMLGKRKWILERKYDGEYCEVHIDQSKGLDSCIKIFSKSGKDSTEDRKGLHETLRRCLRLGQPDCKIKRQAILLGELVVWNDLENNVAGFERIRMHVSRSGVFLGSKQHSQAHACEHLKIVFFDMLLLDDECLIQKPIEERRRWLRETYTRVAGRASSIEWKDVDFSQPRANRQLIQQFAASIATRCEGLVLKPCGVPYFSLNTAQGDFSNCFIKLKKDYIANMGDEADIAVIGASYDAQEALKSGIKGIRWTNFHLGCLMNKDDVQRFDARPVFRLVGTIAQDMCIPNPIVRTANTIGHFRAASYQLSLQPTNFDIQNDNSVKMDVIFNEPLVFEVLGSSFEKPANTAFYMLRHPRVKKMHEDRSWKDCISFQELQQQAREALAAPPDGETQETLKWVEKLEKSLRKKFEKSQTTSRSSAKTTPRSAATTSPMVSRSSASKERAVIVRPDAAETPVQDPKNASTPSTLGGTTLIATPGSLKKRLWEDAESIADDTPICNPKRRCSKPLADVTSNPPQRVPPKPETIMAKEQIMIYRLSKPSAPAARYKLKPAIDSLRQPSANQQAMDERTRDTPSLLRSPLRADTLTHEHDCILSRAIIHLAPCIANAPNITQDLLPRHGIAVAASLKHWDRNSLAHLPLTETVSESQAYAGLRKIVLVESRNRDAVQRLVRQMLALNDGKCRERIEVFDWRALRDECGGEGAGLIQRHRLGVTMFDESSWRAIFASDRAWINQ